MENATMPSPHLQDAATSDAGSARKRLRKFNKYSVLDKGKNRDRHAWLMPDA